MARYFFYRRSTRRQAIKMLWIALGFPLSMGLMLEIFASDKVPESQLLIIYGVALLVSVLLVLMFVIADFRRNAEFRYEVTDQYVSCIYPDFPRGGESYQIKLCDIARLLQIKHTMGRTTHDDFIETVDGKMHRIPQRYDLKIGAVKKAIRSARPEIRSENKVLP
ncbi:MAG: hypothetical protein R6X06_00550 [Gammaproteobacteria bacterium]